MKNLIFGALVVICCVSSNIVNAQNANYASIYFGAGDFFLHTVDAPLQISFPYSATDAAGVTSNHSFKSKTITPYSKPQFGWSVINLEIGRECNFVAAKINVFNNGVNLSLGAGHNFYFDVFENIKDKQGRDFVFRPSLSIDYGIYRDANDGNANDLGGIDNENQTLNILGYEAKPEYSYNRRGHSSERVTVPVKTMEVIFYQRDWALTPKLSFGLNPLKHILHLEAEVCYFIPLSEKGGIQLLQNGDNHLKGSPHIIELDKEGLTATLNNQTITSSPYSFKGFFLGINVGFNIPYRIFEKFGHRNYRSY